MKNVALFLLLSIIIGSLASCQKQINYNTDIASLNDRLFQLQAKNDSLTQAIVGINTNVQLLNSNFTQLNKVVDSIKAQLVLISNQITALRSDLLATNANITQIIGQIEELTTQMNTLLSKLNDANMSISLNTGLVAYYPFTGNANDYSGNGNNGTVHGASLVSDRSNNLNSAYSFNPSSNNYIALPLLTSINEASVVSFSFWVKTNSLSNNGTIFGHWSNNNGVVGVNCGVSIEQFGSTSGISIHNYSGTGGIFSKSITTGIWHHIVINIDFNQTSNSSKVVTYIDNTIQNLTFQQFNNSIGIATSTFIGRRNMDFGTYGNYFDGAIDDFRIYNRNLNSSEVAYLHGH